MIFCKILKMKILSDCLTKENVNALAALLTPFLACIGTYIAWQQYKGNKLKLRHDLYERRFKVYQGLTDLLGFIGREADVHQEQLWAFKFFRASRPGDVRICPQTKRGRFQTRARWRPPGLRRGPQTFRTAAVRAPSQLRGCP
jgi:hypothetical protein